MDKPIICPKGLACSRKQCNFIHLVESEVPVLGSKEEGKSAVTAESVLESKEEGKSAAVTAESVLESKEEGKSVAVTAESVFGSKEEGKSVVTAAGGSGKKSGLIKLNDFLSQEKVWGSDAKSGDQQLKRNRGTDLLKFARENLRKKRSVLVPIEDPDLNKEEQHDEEVPNVPNEEEVEQDDAVWTEETLKCHEKLPDFDSDSD